MLEIIWSAIFLFCSWALYKAEKWNGEWSFIGIALIFIFAVLAIVPLLLPLGLEG